MVKIPNDLVDCVNAESSKQLGTPQPEPALYVLADGLYRCRHTVCTSKDEAGANSPHLHISIVCSDH